MRNTTPVFEGAVRRDFFDPKPVKPAKAPTDWRTVALVSVIVAGVVSSEAIVAWNTSRPAPGPIAVVEPTPRPITPTPTPVPVQRAELVPIDVRRALPVEGAQYRIQMPAGEIVNVTYRGEVPNFDRLPRNPNLNDCYLVTPTKHSWVFMQPSGFSAPAWVDP